MTDLPLLTPQQVVRQLAALGRELDQAISALREADLDAAKKRHLADVKESMAFVNTEGAMEMRKHMARIAASDAEGEALVAEALVRHLRNQIKAIDTRIEIGRSYGAAVRAELKTLGGQEG